MKFTRFESEPFEDFKTRIFNALTENKALAEEEIRLIVDDIPVDDYIDIVSIDFTEL